MNMDRILLGCCIGVRLPSHMNSLLTGFNGLYRDKKMKIVKRVHVTLLNITAKRCHVLSRHQSTIIKDSTYMLY
jgi:hypothetical protein